MAIPLCSLLLGISALISVLLCERQIGCIMYHAMQCPCCGILSLVAREFP